MTTQTTRWITTLTLTAAALLALGCGDQGDTRPVPEAKTAIAKAPIVLRQDPVAQPAPPVANPSNIAVNVAPSSIGKNPSDGSPRSVKASKPVVKEDARLTVKRLVIAEGVSSREPVGAATTFAASEADRIYAFVELENADRLDAEVTVTFLPPDGEPAIGNVTLDVGASPRWRTWAYTRGARQPGTWTAVVRSMSGKVLAKAPFEITK